MYNLGIRALGPQGLHLAQAVPSTSLHEILPPVSSSESLPAMELELLNKPDTVRSQFALETWRELSQILYKGDNITGAREWHRIVGSHRQWLIWGHFVQKHQKAPPSARPSEAGGDWRIYLLEKADFISVLRADIDRAAIKVSDLMALIQRDGALKKTLEPYQRRSRQRFHLGDLQMTLTGQMKFFDPLPFPLLAKIAQLLGQDVQRYIVLSNRSLYPDRSSHFWAHPRYPIYLEGEADMEVMNVLRDGQNRHRVGSMGWQLWAALRDPHNYLSIKDFADKVHLGQGTVRGMILRNKKPSSETVHKMAAAFPDEVRGEFIRAHNDSYYPELARRIVEEDLFPGQTIFIGRRVEDEQKIKRILQRPNHPARFLLGARNLFPEMPGVTVLARELRITSNELSNMEAGRTGLQTETLPAWLRLYERFGTPLELMRIGAAIEYGLAEDDKVWDQALQPPKRLRRGKLPDNLMPVRKAPQAPPVPATTSSSPAKVNGPRALKSTLERLVIEERRPGPDGKLQLVYGREYVGKLDRASIVDGEFRSEIAIINHVRNMSEAAILEIRLAWPQIITEARFNLLRREAAKAAAESSGIKQITLIWRPLEANEKPAAEDERQILFSLA